MEFNLNPIGNYLAVGPLQAAMNCQLFIAKGSNNLIIRSIGTDSLDALLIQAFGENHNITYSEFNLILTFPEGTDIIAFGVSNDGIDRVVTKS